MLDYEQYAVVRIVVPVEEMICSCCLCFEQLKGSFKLANCTVGCGELLFDDNCGELFVA